MFAGECVQRLWVAWMSLFFSSPVNGAQWFGYFWGRASRLKNPFLINGTELDSKNTGAPNHQFTMKVFICCLHLTFWCFQSSAGTRTVGIRLGALADCLEALSALPSFIHPTTWGLYQDKTPVVVLLVGHKHPLC